MTSAVPKAAIAAAAFAIERELMSGRDYSTAMDSDEALARVALEAAAPILLREFAARVNLIVEVAHGYRCPSCHGKPASTPKYGRPYRCGCGNTWTLKRMYDYTLSQGGMLRAVAEGKPLPDLPAKVAASSPSGTPQETGHAENPEV